MTIQMKKKPIKEGFKFLSIYDTIAGFVFYFVPDGLKEEEKKKTIAEKVIAIANKLPGRDDKTICNSNGQLLYIFEQNERITVS